MDGGGTILTQFLKCFHSYAKYTQPNAHHGHSYVSGLQAISIVLSIGYLLFPCGLTIIYGMQPIILDFPMYL